LSADIELRVKATKVDSTEYIENCGDDCIPWNSWYVYTVKVKEVLKGDFKEKNIKVAVLEHAQRKLWYRKNWRIVIKKFTNQENIEAFGTEYFVHKEI